MWDVLSGDFDTKIDAEKCYQNVVRNVEPGSIVVMHDSLKAMPRLELVMTQLSMVTFRIELRLPSQNFKALEAEEMRQLVTVMFSQGSAGP